MRAKEFINENFKAKTHGSSKGVSARADATLPGVFTQQQLRNTDPYMQYRMGMAVASARAHAAGEVEFEQESAFGENLVQVMYAPEDEETIMLASTLMGITPTRITDNASREPNSTGTASPVAKPKRNKYGV
jgi:hypothetical protein